MATAFRQWRHTPGLQRGNGVNVFNVQDESKVSKADASIEDSSGDPAVHVHDIATSRVLQLRISRGSHAQKLKALAQKALGIESEQLVFVFKGQALGDTVPVATILDCGGHIGVARRGVAIEFDPDTLTGDARLSPNNKELHSRTEDYCSTVQQVRAKAPFPTSSRTEFRIQCSGSEIGCYDCIALCTADFELGTHLGRTEGCWSFEVRYMRARVNKVRTMHRQTLGKANPCDVFHCVYDPGARSLSMRIARDGDFTSDPVVVFDSLPSEPLYLVCNVCGHEGRGRLRIVDGSSPATTVDTCEDDFGDWE